MTSHPLFGAATAVPIPSNHNTIHTMSPSSSGTSTPQIRSRKSTTFSSATTQPSVIPQPDTMATDLQRDRTESCNGKQKGKGKERDKTRTSFEEPWVRTTRAVVRDTNAPREVIIHVLTKSDTIAAICLQYGITSQSLRTSNRLWATDSIHLRASLKIPLDMCDLPSSSTIERVERRVRSQNDTEEAGAGNDLVVWERKKESRSSGQTGDLLGLDDVSNSSRSSLDSFREVRPTLSRPSLSSSLVEPSPLSIHRSISPTPSSYFGHNNSSASTIRIITPPIIEGDAVAAYMPSTNNLYSFSSSVTPPSTSYFPTLPSISTSTMKMPSESLNATATSNSSSSSSSSPPSETISSPSSSAYASPSSSTVQLPDHDLRHMNGDYPDAGGGGTLSQKIFHISLVPASELSFFPAPNPSFHSPLPLSPSETTPKRTPALRPGSLTQPDSTNFFSSYAGIGSKVNSNRGPTSYSMSSIGSDGTIKAVSSPTRESNGWAMDYFGDEIP